MPTLKDKGIVLCESCSKPVGAEATIVRSSNSNKTWVYHQTPEDCAYAPDVRKNWRIHGKG